VVLYQNFKETLPFFVLFIHCSNRVYVAPRICFAEPHERLLHILFPPAEACHALRRPILRHAIGAVRRNDLEHRREILAWIGSDFLHGVGAVNFSRSSC
jgi:hypothetical protein